jgi:hypothetical protein
VLTWLAVFASMRGCSSSSFNWLKRSEHFIESSQRSLQWSKEGRHYL